MDIPNYIIIVKNANVKEWDDGIESNILHKISHICNKYKISNILCPWGFSELIFNTCHVSIGIVFQRLLPISSLKLIHNVDVMKYVTTCRYDFIRWNCTYDILLLNPKWVVMPSVSIVKNEGVKVMTCKDQNNGNTQFMIHPPRKPNHTIPLSYS